MTVELGLIHPPVGMNVFVIKSVVRDVKISTVFAGVIPFVVTDILRLAILIAFPVSRRGCRAICGCERPLSTRQCLRCPIVMRHAKAAKVGYPRLCGCTKDLDGRASADHDGGHRCLHRRPSVFPGQGRDMPVQGRLKRVQDGVTVERLAIRLGYAAQRA